MSNNNKYKKAYGSFFYKKVDEILIDVSLGNPDIIGSEADNMLYFDRFYLKELIKTLNIIQREIKRGYL